MERLRADVKPDKSWKILAGIFGVIMALIFGFVIGTFFLVGGFFNRNSAIAILVSVLIGLVSQSGLFIVLISDNKTKFWKTLSGIFLLPFLLFTGYSFFQAICSFSAPEDRFFGMFFIPYLLIFRKWVRMPRNEYGR